jgi:hypothetical protein
MLNPDPPITPVDAAPAANDIVAKPVARWRDGALVSDHLTEALLPAELEQIISGGGPAAAVSVLQELIRQTEDRHWKADWDNHSLSMTPFLALLNFVRDSDRQRFCKTHRNQNSIAPRQLNCMVCNET